jgi:hypothetical protein
VTIGIFVIICHLLSNSHDQKKAGFKEHHIHKFAKSVTTKVQNELFAYAILVFTIFEGHSKEASRLCMNSKLAFN